MRNIVSPLDGFASPLGRADTGLRFLFANGEGGLWYELLTLWTDTGGTTAATDGDDVARIDDKSGNGNNATQATAGLRMTYLEAGGYRYLSGNGTDDTYSVTLPDLGTDATVAYCDEAGVTILENQTISGAYSLPLVNQLYGIVILDRAMTSAEQARVTAYFDRKRSTIIDVLLVTGQSNAEGRGDSASSPDAVNGVKIVTGTASFGLSDPVGGASTGSMWPAFVNEYFAQTGRSLAVVEAATGGTGLLPDAGGEWSPAGSLRAAAVTALDAAVSDIEDDLPDHSVGNVYVVWSQGEADAQAYNGTTVTGAAYKSALEALADYFEANISGFAKMGVVRLGSINNRDEATEWAEFRQAQEDACEDADNLVMLYRGASGFAKDGRGLMSDDLHYDQTGLNIAGELAARAFANGVSPAVPTAPSILATAAFADTDPTVNETTRTDSHTTATGTKMLLVAVTSEIVNTNTTRNVTGVTFGGVAMTEANTSNAGVAAGDSSSPGRVDVGLFYLTETDYGSSLSGVTGDIVVTMSGATNMLSSAAVDLDAEGIQEAGFTDNFGGVYGGTPTDTTSSVLVAGAPCAVVAIQSSVATSGAALTHTLSGAAFTEVTDSGGDNGSGKSGQRVVATASVAEGVYTVTSTLSANADCGVLYVVGFRGKIDGE